MGCHVHELIYFFRLTHMDMALLLIQSSVCCACALSRRDGKLSVDRSGTTPIMSKTKENVRKNTLSQIEFKEM
jgi:hypothetical protein